MHLLSILNKPFLLSGIHFTATHYDLQMHSMYSPSSFSPDTMAQPPLTDSLFSTENENNITVTQEDARPHPETDQLVSSTPHMPRWRRDDGEMLCVLLAPSPIDTAPNTQHLLPHTLTREQRRVLLEDMLPLPSQDTTHQGGGLDLLVCPSLPRPCGVQILSGTVQRSLARNEEWAEVVCVDGGGERTNRNMLRHTSNTTEPSSEVEISFGVMDISEHRPHYYIPPQQVQLPLETAQTHNSSGTLEDDEFECNTVAEKSPTPATQRFVSGRTVTDM